MKLLVKALPLDPALGELNERLKAGRHKVRVERRGQRLYLRATLPDRHDPSQRRQQNITLGLEATLTGLVGAEDLAIKLSLGLRTDRFTWADWIEQSPEDEVNQPAQLTVDTFQAHAKAMHASKYRKDPERGVNAWTKKWAPALKKMPPSGPVTEAVLLRIIRTMPEGSAGRRDQGNLLCSVGESLGLELPKARVACRGYGVAQLTPRDIPSDSEIEEIWTRIKLPHWRWMWGVCAAFGLRPHEAANLEIRPDGLAVISDHTKTGGRICSACPSRWISEYELHNLPRPTQAASSLAKVFGDALERDGITLRPYVLRHAYAIRTMAAGLPVSLSARMMGHSENVHSQTYQRWISKDQIIDALTRFNL